MKTTTQFLLLGLLATTMACHGQISGPGWFCVNPQGRTFPAMPTLDVNQSQAEGAGLITPQVQGVPTGPVAETITPQIQALADSLQDDPETIFDYVHDQIHFVLYFGSKKGAELTLLEKSGNDFDQSALLVALLRAAGYTNVQYQFGWMYLYYDDAYGYDYDVHHWWQLTLDNTDWTTTTNYLADLLSDRGYPCYVFYDDGNTFLLQRTWVALTMGSTTYQLDPAFKRSEQVSGISLTNAMGGTGTAISNALWTAADGSLMRGFCGDSYIWDLYEGSIQSELTANTTSLLNYIQSNSPNASVQQILGGWQIVPAETYDFSIDGLFPTTTWYGTMQIQSWANEPTNMMSTLEITFAGMSYQWFMPQLQGQRIVLTFDAYGTAQLWQDDTLLVSQSTIGSSSANNVILFAHHPSGSWNYANNTFIDGTYDDQITTNTYQLANSTYVLLYAFEPDWDWLQQRENMLDAYLQQGLANGSRQVTSETLNVMGLNWMLQSAQAEQILASQLGCRNGMGAPFSLEPITFLTISSINMASR
jgi:hypothetical protein